MPSASPPLRMLCLSMQTLQPSSQQGHEPVAMVCTMHPNTTPDASDLDRDQQVGMRVWGAVRRIDSRPLPRDSETVLPKAGVQHCNSETSMLQSFLAKVQEFDPDIIVGHNAYGFDLDVLASRMAALRIPLWQKLGRLRRSKERCPTSQGRQGSGFWIGTSVTAGRLVCDIQLQARDLLPKLGSYDLPSLGQSQLVVTSLREVEPETLQLSMTRHSLLWIWQS